MGAQATMDQVSLFGELTPEPAAEAAPRSTRRSRRRARVLLPRRERHVDTGIVAQVRQAFGPRARLATSVGMLLGGFVPVATFVLAHTDLARLFGADGLPWAKTWALIIGGLLYSALTVYQWAKLAFTSAPKAFGFVVLLEGVMVTSSTRWLAFAALGYLVVINGIATGCTLSVRRAVSAGGAP